MQPYTVYKTEVSCQLVSRLAWKFEGSFQASG